MKERFGKAWPAAASALLLLIAFPPFNLGLLALVALAPWLASLRGTTGWGAFRSGYWFGMVYQAGQLAWMQPLVAAWTKSWLLGFLPLVVGTILTALFFSLFAVLARACWGLGAPWLLAIVWAGVEVLRSYVPLFAFPWGLAGTPLWQYTPIIQSAHYGTIYLVSAWAALSCSILAQFLVKEPVAKMRAPILAWILILGVSLVRYAQPIPGVMRTITVGQLGVNLAFEQPDVQNQIRDAVESLFLNAQLQHSSLLVLPEGTAMSAGRVPPSMPFRYPDDIPFVLGGQRGTQPRYQSAFAYDGTWKYADKTRLVIFGEYVPGRSWIPFLSSFNLPGGDLTAGDDTKALQVGNIKVGPILCFEGLFHDVAFRQALNGAQLLAVMSIDDWYMGTNAPDQLKVASVFRAIETGLPLVRSASLGYTLAVNPRGHIVSEAPLGKRFPLHAELQIPAKPDLFIGVSVFPVLALAALPAVWLLDYRKRRRQVSSDKC